ncbi:hypothetical protein FACS1894102_5330 [Spirochaetia bacterium]|nr:hypothetical protein FACS1894102_5330 [Spirochaetia bacterium]
MPAREFKRPETGIVDITVCAKSGQYLTAACREGAVTLTHLSKFTPTGTCTYHNGGGSGVPIPTWAFEDNNNIGDTLNMPTLNLDIFDTPPSTNNTNQNKSVENNQGASTNNSTIQPALDALQMPTWDPLTE